MASAIDNRDVDELLDFINSSEPKPVNSAKAAKRARHKQKKKVQTKLHSAFTFYSIIIIIKIKHKDLWQTELKFYPFLFQEKAQQGNGVGAAGSDPNCNSSEPADEPVPDGSEANRLLDWPQLELERVNSFLTSRLEEIKNTIKDSIRASFSMYDLNLDVNDFPKKAATLEGNHLLSHLNGSSDPQQIDLDLAPLSLGTFKNHLDLSNGWEETTVSCPSLTSSAPGVPAPSKDIQRLHTAPSLSKLIRVQSPERCTSARSDTLPEVPAQSTAKSKEEAPDLKNTAVGSSSSKSKKNKKQQQRQEQSLPEQSFNKQTKVASGNETQKNNESKDTAANVTKTLNKQLQHSENHRNGSKKPEEGKSSKHPPHGSLSNALKGKGDAETRERPEEESENKVHHAISANGQQQHQQQTKGKNKKNKNKGEKPSSALGTWSYV